MIDLHLLLVKDLEAKSAVVSQVPNNKSYQRQRTSI